MERHGCRGIAKKSSTLYDAGIRWMDAQVARLVETLRELGLWQDCVMALTADHGEEFLDHGGRYHPPSRVAEELVRVPLLLHGPGLPQAVKVAEPFSLLHLAPTLLDLVDVPIPGSFRGRSHASLRRNGTAWESDAIIECVAGCSNPFVTENRLRGARAGGPRGTLQDGARLQFARRSSCSIWRRTRVNCARSRLGSRNQCANGCSIGPGSIFPTLCDRGTRTTVWRRVCEIFVLEWTNPVISDVCLDDRAVLWERGFC